METINENEVVERHYKLWFLFLFHQATQEIEILCRIWTRQPPCLDFPTCVQGCLILESTCASPSYHLLAKTRTLEVNSLWIIIFCLESSFPSIFFLPNLTFSISCTRIHFFPVARLHHVTLIWSVQVQWIRLWPEIPREFIDVMVAVSCCKVEWMCLGEFKVL